MEAMDTLDLVESVFGRNASMTAMFSSSDKVSCILYEAFHLQCGTYGEYGTFAAGILIGEIWQSEFFGQQLSLNADAASIVRSLKIIDSWCISRLPTAFVQALAEGLAK